MQESARSHITTPEQDFLRWRTHGDAAALGRVFDRLAPELLLVAGHVAARGSAEDLVQTVFLRAIEGAERWDPERPLMPWLVGILVRLSLRDRARHGRERDGTWRDGANEPVAHDTPPLAAEREEVAQAVAAALADLPTTYRQALTLRLVHGFQPAAIAHALGVPPDTIKSRLRRGLERLRRALPTSMGAPALLVDTPRDLDAVRRAVMARAAARAAIVQPAAAVGVAALGGVVLMSKSTLITACLAAIALVSGALYWSASLVPDDDGPSGPPAASLRLSPPLDDVAPQTGVVEDDSEVAARTSLLVSEPSAAHDWSIAGRVRFGSYGTLPDAPVIVSLYAGLGVTGQPLVEARVRSDANGEFTWSGPAPTETVTLQVIAELDGHKVFPDVRTATVGDPGPRDLAPAAYVIDTWIKGLVVDTEGNGVAGARVITSLSEARTSDDGGYRVSTFSGYPVSTVRVIAAGYATEVLALGLLRAGDVEADTIELQREAAVRGRVVDASGAPISGAEVSCHLSRELRTTTAEDGRFRLGSLDPTEARSRISASATGYVSTTRTVTAETFGSAAEVEFDLVLLRGASVSGRVLDERGHGVVNAIVTWGGYPNSIGPRIVCTDERGAFTLKTVPSGRQSIWARRDGLSADKITVDVPGPGESLSTLEIVLRPGHRITGRVVDPAGRPVAGAQVRPEPPRGSSEVYGGEEARTGSDGSFELRDLRAQQIDVRVYAEGLAMLQQSIRAGDDTTLRLEAPGGIAGLVVDGATGAPLDSFVVRLLPSRREARDRPLNGYGIDWARSGKSFRGTAGVWSTSSEKLDIGAVIDVEVSASGYASTLVERVVVSSNPVPSELRIELRDGVTLRGYVVDAATGVPLASARVRRFTPGDDRSGARYRADEGCVTRTDAAGSFRLERVPFGTMYLIVDETERPLAIDGPFDVTPPSSTVERTIAVTSGGQIVGRFLDGAGQPLSQQRVTLSALETPGDERPTYRARTDADGRFHFEHLVRGLYHLHGSVTEPGASLAVGAGLLRLVEVEDGHTLEVELQPRGRATINGAIEFDGVLPDSLRVELRPPQPAGGQWASSVSYAGVRDGTFRAPFLEAGEWNVSVFHIDKDGELVTGGTNVQVPEEGTVEVRISLTVVGR